MLLASERKRAALYKKELAWIRRGARARSTKAKSHIERFEELRDSKLIIDDSSLSIGTVSSRLGKKIIEIENLSKAYGEKQLIRDFTYTVLRNDRTMSRRLWTIRVGMFSIFSMFFRISLSARK